VPPSRRERATTSIVWLGPLVFAVTALGVCLRLAYFFRNPSLTVDEASLALNIVDRPFASIFHQLDFNQAAPPGFLALQKLIVDVVGGSPYSLRLLPLVAGIAGALLVYPVAAAVVGRTAAILALALVAVSEPLITYAATNKPYSVDVAVALGLYLIAFRLPSRISSRNALWLGVTGATAVWISHPAAFVLAAVGLVLLTESLTSRRWPKAATICVVSVAWLISFTIAYALTRSSVEQIQHSIAGSSSSSALGDNGQPGLFQTYGGLVRSLVGIPSFSHGIRTAMAVAAILLVVGGLVVLLRADPAYSVARRQALLLTIPAGISLIACAFGLYPLYPRTFLFLIPALAILLAAGAQFLWSSDRPRFVSLLARASVATLLAMAIYASVDLIQSSPKPEAVGALQYLARHARKGDSLYLYLTAQYDFRYYLECGCFGSRREVERARTFWPIRPTGGQAQFAPALQSVPPRLVVGSARGSGPVNYQADFQSLRGRKRVWILVIDATPKDQRGLTTFLEQHGVQRAAYERSPEDHGASVLLFDLSAT
jgi:4-amino-4-deoxy-L-arabinose transferase-like glycosyltransferase